MDLVTVRVLHWVVFYTRYVHDDDDMPAIIISCASSFPQVGGFKLPFLFIGVFVLLLVVPCGLTVWRISELASA